MSLAQIIELLNGSLTILWLGGPLLLLTVLTLRGASIARRELPVPSYKGNLITDSDAVVESTGEWLPQAFEAHARARDLFTRFFIRRAINGEVSLAFGTVESIQVRVGEHAIRMASIRARLRQPPAPMELETSSAADPSAIDAGPVALPSATSPATKKSA